MSTDNNSFSGAELMPLDISMQSAGELPVLPLTLGLDGGWLASLAGVDISDIDIAKINGMNATLERADTTADDGLFAIGVFSLEETSVERKLKKGKLPDPLELVRLFRGLSRHYIDVKAVLERHTALISNPEKAIAILQNQESGNTPDRKTLITPETLIAGLIGGRTSEAPRPTRAVSNGSGSTRRAGNTATDGQPKPDKTRLSLEKKAFLDDPANQKAVAELQEAGFDPSRSIYRQRGKLNFVKINNLQGFKSGIEVRFPEASEKDINNLVSKYCYIGNHRLETVLKKLDNFTAKVSELGMAKLDVGTLTRHITILKFSTETINTRLSVRLARLPPTGLSTNTIQAIANAGYRFTKNSDQKFELGVTILENMRTIDINSTPMSYFDHLIGGNFREDYLMYCALNTAVLSRANITEFFGFYHKAYQYGSVDLNDYIQENRDRHANSEVHQKLLALYDEIKRTKRNKPVDSEQKDADSMPELEFED